MSTETYYRAVHAKRHKGDASGSIYKKGDMIGRKSEYSFVNTYRKMTLSHAQKFLKLERVAEPVGEGYSCTYDTFEPKDFIIEKVEITVTVTQIAL